ncbi:AI-2E family transporter [Agromyces atrinae]|jgi:predicted PurR-regulated permease PerM|uniref:AI-2E family transporter n=1 Tax=Agromyces atrinae TaxID=592376 RepID=A0A4Q2M531_9MICO|nr:AI-2E family transporter [Agromyces atrinae]NYD66543.1 putative PurR-regulated permease PerM [Agromyces atrinae]RXZ87215.1 AI-2E family transporter [Agromyces atrinae]
MKISNAFRAGLVGTLGVGLGILILTSIASLSTILLYIGAALFLALGLDPAISWFERKGLPRWAAILIVLVVVLVLFAGVILAIIPIVADQVGQLIEQVPSIIARVTSQEWIEALQDAFPMLQVDEIIQGVIQAVTDFLQDPAKVTELAGGVLAVAVGIGSGVFGAIVVLILTLYFAASLNTMKRATYQLVPASKRARFADITEQITQSVGRYVVGQVSLAAVNGILSFIFLSIIRAPFPAVLALVAFSLSLIPLVGTLTGSVIIVLVCLIPGLGSPLTALVAAIWYIVYMQVEAYVLSPRIMNRAVQVPGAVVVIAALAGGSLLSVLGALIAIPIAASILLIIKQVVIPRQNEL